MPPGPRPCTCMWFAHCYGKRQDHAPSHLHVVCPLQQKAIINLRLLEQACGCSTVRVGGRLNQGGRAGLCRSCSSLFCGELDVTCDDSGSRRCAAGSKPIRGSDPGSSPLVACPPACAVLPKSRPRCTRSPTSILILLPDGRRRLAQPTSMHPSFLSPLAHRREGGGPRPSEGRGPRALAGRRRSSPLAGGGPTATPPRPARRRRSAALSAQPKPW